MYGVLDFDVWKKVVLLLIMKSCEKDVIPDICFDAVTEEERGYFLDRNSYCIFKVFIL